MLAAVFLYSLLPLLVVLAGGRESPWLFVFLRRVGMALGMVGYLALRQPGFLLDREVWRRVLGRLAGRHMLSHHAGNGGCAFLRAGGPAGIHLRGDGPGPGGDAVLPCC